MLRKERQRMPGIDRARVIEWTHAAEIALEGRRDFDLAQAARKRPPPAFRTAPRVEWAFLGLTYVKNGSQTSVDAIKTPVRTSLPEKLEERRSSRSTSRITTCCRIPNRRVR
jgi:hypothetical protein